MHITCLSRDASSFPLAWTNADNLLGGDAHDSSKPPSGPRWLCTSIPRPSLGLLSQESVHSTLLKSVLGTRSLRAVTKVRDVSIGTASLKEAVSVTAEQWQTQPGSLRRLVALPFLFLSGVLGQYMRR